MRIHKITNGIWAGESKDSQGVPPGWVACETEPQPGQAWGSGGWCDASPDFGDPILAPPTIDEYVAAMEALYDTTAQERRYDNRFTCALRAGYPGPFQAEGLAFASWMDTCNATGYQIMAEVETGARPQPTIAELLADLPAMVWPV